MTITLDDVLVDAAVAGTLQAGMRLADVPLAHLIAAAASVTGSANPDTIEEVPFVSSDDDWR